MDGNLAASSNPGRTIYHVPTPSEILATVEEDSSIDVPSPEGGPGQRLIKLPNGELVFKQVAVPATSQPEHRRQVMHPNATQPGNPAPNLTGDPSAIERDAGDESRADDDRLITREVRPSRPLPGHRSTCSSALDGAVARCATALSWANDARDD